MTNSANNLFETYSLEVLPFICKQMINGKDYSEFIKKYVYKIKKKVHELKINLHELSKTASCFCINTEEKKTIKQLHELRDAQLTNYCKALYKLERFLKNPKLVFVSAALNCCNASEKIWKRILEGMCGIVVLNLQSRGLQHIF